jgi:hypothetical protein
MVAVPERASLKREKTCERRTASWRLSSRAEDR